LTCNLAVRRPCRPVGVNCLPSSLLYETKNCSISGLMNRARVAAAPIAKPNEKIG